jgi:hypothetical protein
VRASCLWFSPLAAFGFVVVLCIEGGICNKFVLNAGEGDISIGMSMI